MIHNIVIAVINFTLVSVPEGFIWTLAVLITLKRFDLLDKYRWKTNALWLSIPILFSSFLINFLRYIVDCPRIFISISAILAIYIGIIIILKAPSNNILNEKIDYPKIFLIVLLYFAVLIVLTESLYIPFVIKYYGKSIMQINSIWSVNFLMALPGRIIQFIFIICILSIQNRKKYLTIIKLITSDKKISLIIIIFVLTLIIFWTILISIFGDYNVLSQYGIIQQVIFSMILFIFPSLLLFLMIVLIILFIEKINKLNRSHQNMFDDVFDDDI